MLLVGYDDVRKQSSVTEMLLLLAICKLSIIIISERLNYRNENYLNLFTIVNKYMKTVTKLFQDHVIHLQIQKQKP